MIPRVYPGQHLPPGNSDLVINGPATGWEPDELAAFVTFVVTQNGSVPATVGIGETTLLKRRSDGGDFDWSAAVTRVSGPQFKTGPAKVHAWASVAETGGPGDPYDCDVDITLS
ncbi:MAG TPA: hypothetical protein VGJ11_04425 [Gaiellales bacterium]|jgi:hypothetical protein